MGHDESLRVGVLASDLEHFAGIVEHAFELKLREVVVHESIVNPQQMLGLAELKTNVPGAFKRLANLSAGGAAVVDQSAA